MLSHVMKLRTMNQFSVELGWGKWTTGLCRVPLAFVLGAAFVATVGCTSPPSLASHTLVTWDEGVCQRVPCTMVRVNGGFGGISCDVAECAPGSFPDGNYRGLSGAPVLDQNGELVGATSRVIGDTGDRVLALVPSRTLDRTLSVALEACHGATVSVAARALPAVEPGQSVAVVTIWGDHVEGGWGRVALVDGDHFVCFAHEHGGQPLGPLTAQVYSAPVLAIPRLDGDSASIVTIGSLIGRAEMNSKSGVVAHIGEFAPTVSVTFEYTGLDGRTFDRREYWCVIDAANLRRRLTTIVNVALTRIWSVPMKSLHIRCAEPEIHLSIEVDDLDSSTFLEGLIDKLESAVLDSGQSEAQFSLGIE